MRVDSLMVHSSAASTVGYTVQLFWSENSGLTDAEAAGDREVLEGPLRGTNLTATDRLGGLTAHTIGILMPCGIVLPRAGDALKVRLSAPGGIVANVWLSAHVQLSELAERAERADESGRSAPLREVV